MLLVRLDWFQILTRVHSNITSIGRHRGSRSAHLACVFDVELGRKERKSVRSTACEEVYSRSALVMPMVDSAQKQV